MSTIRYLNLTMARRTLFTGSQELCDSRSIYVPILRPTALEIATIREDHFGLHCSCIASPTDARYRRERVKPLLYPRLVPISGVFQHESLY